MLGWFKKKTLEEEISIVKQEAKKREATCKYANLGYCYIAVDLNLEQAAKFFLFEYIKQESLIIFNEGVGSVK
jgi:hypothetical protein